MNEEWININIILSNKCYFIVCYAFQEYPIQLVYIADHDRLEKFLVDWAVFDALYDIEYSGALIKYWRIVSNF